MNQAIRKLSGLLALPVLLAALLMMPMRAKAEEVPYECFAELPVSVELNGENEEKFHVTIEPAEGMDETAPLPEEAAGGLLIAGDASDTFHNFHFTTPGDYSYVVKQEAGSTAYMSYDDTVYIVTVRVTNADNGGLQAEIWATTKDDPDTKVRELRFLNTYAPPTPTPTPAPAATARPDEGDPAPTATPIAPSALPKTGDTLPLAALVVVMALAAAAVLVLAVLRKRQNKQNGRQ